MFGRVELAQWHNYYGLKLSSPTQGVVEVKTSESNACQMRTTYVYNILAILIQEFSESF